MIPAWFYVFLICFYTLYPPYVTADNDDDQILPLSEPASIENQLDGAVELTPEQQVLAGLQTRWISKSEYQPDYPVYGICLDLSPLLEFQSLYLTRQAELDAARARLSASEQAIRRIKNLHQNESASTRQLQSQQSQWQTDKADFIASQQRFHALKQNAKLRWGSWLTDQLTHSSDDFFPQLIEGKLRLLQISLPSGRELPDGIAVPVANDGIRHHAQSAQPVAELPQIDSLSQGRQYLLTTTDTAIRPGMKISAWIRESNSVQSGIIVPFSALGWHLGEPFVFVKTDEQTFLRQTVSSPLKTASGYFIHDVTDAEIVISGTQLLLSYEFRAQIPDEDD